MSAALEKLSAAALASQYAATNTLLNRNKEEETATMTTLTNTNSDESGDRTWESTASNKEHSTMPVYDTSAFDNLCALMELLNDDGNDEDDYASWPSMVSANHLVRLRNCNVSIQEGTVALQSEPVPIYDVNRSQSLQTSVSFSDLSDMDFDANSARIPVSGEGEFTLEMNKQPVNNGRKFTDAERSLPTTLSSEYNVVRTAHSSARGNSRPENLCKDEVDGDARTHPPLTKEKSLEFLSEKTMILRSHWRFCNKSLYARPNRLLQMVTMPGGSLPAEFMFKRRVYKHKFDNHMVCCFLSVKYSAYIQVTKDKKVIVGDDQPLDGYPKPCERFSLTEDLVDHVSPVTVTNPKMYVDYDTKTYDVLLSEDGKAGFSTFCI